MNVINPENLQDSITILVFLFSVALTIYKMGQKQNQILGEIREKIVQDRTTLDYVKNSLDEVQRELRSQNTEQSKLKSVVSECKTELNAHDKRISRLEEVLNK